MSAFRISYIFAKLHITCPSMDYDDIAGWFSVHILRKSKYYNADLLRFERYWPDIRAYLGNRIERIICDDPEFKAFVENLYTKDNR